jgi:hypothetical protein
MSDYTAASIRILPPQEVVERYDWAKIGALAAQYSVPAEFVERGLEACRRAGAEPEYFVGRYLAGDKSIPKNAEVEDAHREILAESRGKRG